MQCSYSIEFGKNCKNSQVILQISPFLRELANDTLSLIADGKVIQSFDKHNRTTFTKSFPQEVKLGINFTSGHIDAEFYPAPSITIIMNSNSDENHSPYVGFSCILLLITLLIQI